MKSLVNSQVLVLFFLLSPINLWPQTFTDSGISLPGVSNGSVTWGDCDNDGKPDILIAGFSSDNLITIKVFHNNGSNSFTDLGNVLSPAIPNEHSYTRWNALWDDFDNDGNIDILIRGQTDISGNFLMIYKNEENNTFTLKSTISYLTMEGSAVDCGDYDNDGDKDILLTFNWKSVIYQNQGDFVFNEQYSVLLAGIASGSCKWGDYDNDGDLDVLTASALFQNQGNNVFTRLDGISIYHYGESFEWGDYNNDGFLDILHTGNGLSAIYKNNRNNTFTEQTAIVLKGVRTGTGEWGDLNNDGNMDIIISGDNEVNYVTTIYLNNGDNTFTEATSIVLDGIKESSVDLGDYDNDGDLDILLSGNKGTSKITELYSNESSIANPLPSAPTGLSSESIGSDIILKWEAVSTDNTTAGAISYNIMVGTTSGSIDVVSPNSSNTGLRRISGMGNGQLDTTFILRNLKKGTYYWKVQAVDNSFKGSDFSDQATFAYSASYQAFGLNVPVIGGKEAALTWSRGNGENCIVFMKEGNNGLAEPENNISYTASGIFKLGTPIGVSGWYCVYSGTQSKINVTGLEPDTDYIFQVFEFDGVTGSEDYNIKILPSNPLTFKTGHFTELKNVNLQAVNTSNYNEQTPSARWFDFDNDDDLDLLFAGGNASVLYSNDGNDLFTFVPATFTKGNSAACGDYDNDGYIDIMIGYNPSILYRNNGDGTFSEQTSISLPNLTLGSVSWGDFDNNGYPDIALSGISDGGRIAKVFRNNGNSTFSEQNLISLSGVAGGNLTWGDYNNDGFSDLLLSGMTNSGSFITKVYRNSGINTLIEQPDIILPGSFSLAEWGDFDNDGDLDILLADHQSGLTKIYRNDGNNTFSEQDSVSLDPLRYGSAAWGDYNNDGEKDLLMTGSTGSSQFTKIFRNNGNDTFTQDNASSFTDVGYSSASWGDYDNDGDLDVALTGNSEDGPVSKIYRNDLKTANIKPDAPDRLISSVSKSDVTLKWNRVRTDNTPCKTISYNIKVGTTSGSINVVSPQSSESGFRRLVSLGNCNLDSAYILKKLPFGTYYWSVQAIDNGFAGGSFSAEGTFDVVPVQAKGLSAKILNNNSLHLKWERGNGERCVVFCKQTSSGMSTPVDNTGYIADNEFGYGAQIGSTGWYCVYNGRADSVNVSGLIYQKEYSFHVIEYMGTFGSEQYFTLIEDGNPGVFSTSLFAEQTGITFSYGYPFPSTSTWGDYDNDGFLDLLIPGSPTRIYHNNGDNNFIELPGFPLMNIHNGSAAWGDYDNDGDLDFIITGATVGDFSDPAAKIFRNDGSGIFTEQTQISLTGVYLSSVDWGDYNNDGNLDLLLTGATGIEPDFKPISKIYRNNGNNTFTEQSQISLAGILTGSGVWGDYDNDGDLDILLSGSIDYQYNFNGVFKIYRNNGNNTFTEQPQIQSPSGSWSSSAWGDYDNDGDLDFLITSLGSLSIYENLGTDLFAEYDYSSLGAYSGSPSAAWGDYDNDGYLDILVTNPNLDSKIFRNIYGKSFNQQDDESLISAGYGFIGWADYDNDGDLDFLLAHVGLPARIFKNNLIMKSGLFKANTSPAAPSGLSSTKSPMGVTLKWEPVINDKTPIKTMTYNIRIGTNQDSANICPPHSAITGFRKIPKIGNAQMDTTFIIKNLKSGKYFWSVQAVDHGFMGGIWSEVDSFEVKNVQTFYSADTVCLGFSTQFTDQSVATDGITSWSWDFKDGTTSTSQNPVHTYSAGGTYNVKLVITSTGGVKDSLEQNIIIKPRPVTGFTALPTCQGLPLSITNTTDNRGLDIISWYWEFGDGQISTTQQPPPHGYLIAGDYSVTLKAVAGNGCSDSISKNVTLAIYPDADITTNAPLSFCDNDSIVLSVKYNNDYQYRWMVDGTTITSADSNILVPKFSGSITVEIVNTVGNCKTTSSSVIAEVKPIPYKPIITSINYETGKCLSENPIRLNVDQLVPGYKYQWFRNGVPLTEATLPYLEGFLDEGDYSLEVDLNGCKNNSDILDIFFANAPEKPFLYARGPTIWYLACSSTTAKEYKWYCNGELIEGANDYFYIAGRKMGDYQVSVSNDQGCFTRSDIVTIPTGTTGIDDIDPFEGLKIYPNPTTGVFTIEMDNDICGELIIEIITEQGKGIRNIKSEKTTSYYKTEIDLGSEPKGIYFVNLRIDRYLATRKVIIE